MKKLQNWKTRLTNLKTKKIKIMNYIFNIMKDLIRTVFLTMAIYWGAIAANSDDVNIWATVVFSVSSSGFVMTKDNQK